MLGGKGVADSPVLLRSRDRRRVSRVCQDRTGEGFLPQKELSGSRHWAEGGGGIGRGGGEVGRPLGNRNRPHVLWATHNNRTIGSIVRAQILS